MVGTMLRCSKAEHFLLFCFRNPCKNLYDVLKWHYRQAMIVPNENQGETMMKRWLSAGLAGIMLTSVAVCAGGCMPSDVDMQGNTFSDADVTLTADAAQVVDISDTLFGVFLEDINYASYAMDDNLLCNGSFEFSDATRAWSATDAAITGENAEPVISTSLNYLRVDAEASGATLSNSGFAAVPIAVTEGASYTFSAFIKATAYNGEIGLRLSYANGIVAEGSITVSESTEWVKYQTTLTASETRSNLSFELVFSGAGELYLDGVSLVTSEATDGIKNYMYEVIEELSPKFVRFPGGCVIEGRTMDDAYDWKNSIGVNEADEVPEFTYTCNVDGAVTTVTTRGEPITRKPNTDIWQNGSNYYLMEYGVGFYEYFLLCENLGASAIPIVNCGLSCMIQTAGGGRFNRLEGRYGNGIEDYIQDALDLVAFAKGDVNSTDENEAYWAQVRADMGHEEPFDMTYLGIGNEQWGDTYYDYYEQFIEAFREAEQSNPDLYEGIELIVGNGTSFNDIERSGTGGLARTAARSYMDGGNISSLKEYGVQDHHYYMNYADFFMNTTVYDGYRREGELAYDVFVGEYSANQANSLSGYTFAYEDNNWITALSEAAYMTGIERNGDIIKLAAYAPMFGALNATNQWTADMMFFTSTSVVRTPNYYVQQLFMRNQSSGVLATEATYADAFERTYDLVPVGGIGSVSINKMYQVIGVDGATGDVIVKLVNASSDYIKANVELSSVSVTGYADVTLLSCENTAAKNSASEENIAPEYFTLGVKSTFGYEIPPYSVAVIRVHTK